MSIISSLALTFSPSAAENQKNQKSRTARSTAGLDSQLPTSDEEVAHHVPVVSVTAQSTTAQLAQNSGKAITPILSSNPESSSSSSSSASSGATITTPTPTATPSSSVYVVSPRAVDANATLINNIGTTIPVSPSSSQLINDLLDSDDVVLGDEASEEDEDEEEDVEVEDTQLEFEDELDSYSRNINSSLNSLYTPSHMANNNGATNNNNNCIGAWNAFSSNNSPPAPAGRPRCPSITVGKAQTGDKTISWVATSSDGKTIQRATKITYYAREKALNNATDLFSRWGLTQARGERLPTAVNATFTPYINSRTVMGRFSMPSVFNMFSALDVDDANHDDGSDLVFYDQQ